MSSALDDPPISSTRHFLIFDHYVRIKSGNMPQRGTKIKMPSLVFLCLFVAVPVIEAGPQAPVKTVLDGVFSEAQAKRGEAAYAANCGVCHGADLEGVSAPELKGTHFLERWREDMLDTIYNYIKDNMPQGRAPDASRIPDTDYLNILTHILNVNGYRAGASDLTADLLEKVILVGKNGPQPVPDGSLVVTVGCLSQARDGVWILFSAMEPVRARRSTISTAAELNASSQKRPGSLIFRLADLEAVPDFVPDSHKGHKLQAKGYLTRQPGAERISLSSITVLDSMCGQ